jgi:GNAT superfamily N-acetyltransferase
MPGRLEIRPVHSKGELDAFIKLPFRLYADEPKWVPPLLLERRRFLDRRRNPFFEHARAEYFLAVRDGRPVGRITAQVDDNFQAYQRNDWGFFGFFECEDDAGAAQALVDAARSWLADQGCDHMVGPCDFTTNDPCGVLIEGFDRMPLVLQPWTPRHYPALLERAGLGKAMDLWMWEIHISDREKVHPAIFQVADSIADNGFTVRNLDKQDFEAEVARFFDVYHSAWRRNWGFVPLTPNEIRHYARELKPLLSEDWAWLVEKDGQVAGAALTLPDYNQVLRHMNGRLLPLGWLRALYWRRRISRVRQFALGVKPEFQHSGVAARLYTLHFEAAEKTGIHLAELGWILETNDPINRALEGLNGRIVRRFRLYETALDVARGD